MRSQPPPFEDTILPVGPTNYHAFLPRPEVKAEHLASALERAIERIEAITRACTWLAVQGAPPDFHACRHVRFLDQDRTQTSTVEDLLAGVRAYGKESAGLPLVSGGAAREAAQIFLSYVALTQPVVRRSTTRCAKRSVADDDAWDHVVTATFSVPVFNLLYGRFLETNGAAVGSLRRLVALETSGAKGHTKGDRIRRDRPDPRRCPR